LQAQANGSESSSSSISYVFTRNLYFGITGNDVKELQTFLISQNAGPAARKLAAHRTTTYFGSLTQNALIEFQKSAGIHPAIGYFGPITRAYVNNLMQ
jgi:peptidoglycan hydrolase-like protein with peptidoglycan-binding domain